MHIPVLLNEAIKYLNPKSGDVVIDATVGSGGHSQLICGLIGGKGVVVGVDQDMRNLETSKTQISKSKCQTKFANDNFRNLDKIAESLGIEKADGILFDLGLNSRQLEDSGRPAYNASGVVNAGRGFTFQKDELLLMTFKTEPEEGDLTAREILNNWTEKEIADAIYEYGDERYGRRIAAGIVRARQEKKIETTFELVEIIRVNVPAAYRNNRRINCCTRTFQALRIAVNDEMNALKEGLDKAWNLLEENGRMVVISFHSLEDKIVKDFFRGKKNEGNGTILTKKPIAPSREEVDSNARSRSAKLRAIQKTTGVGMKEKNKYKNHDKNN